MKRAFVVIVCLLICFTLCAFAYTALESTHECHGEENCPICRIIAVISSFFAACVVLCSVALCFVLSVRRESLSESAPQDRLTLIDLKVKLLN